MDAVDAMGFQEATPIQSQSIPKILDGQDLMGIAQTGTGKTASFVLPMIDVLANGRARARMPRSLILEPTRELAAQVAENFEKYGKYHKLSMALRMAAQSLHRVESPMGDWFRRMKAKLGAPGATTAAAPTRCVRRH